MSQSPLPKTQSAQGAKPAHAHKSGASQKRRRLAKMSLGVISVGALIAVAAVFAVDFSTAPAPVAENGASHTDPNSVATIVLHQNERLPAEIIQQSDWPNFRPNNAVSRRCSP